MVPRNLASSRCLPKIDYLATFERRVVRLPLRSLATELFKSPDRRSTVVRSVIYRKAWYSQFFQLQIELGVTGSYLERELLSGMIQARATRS